MKRTLIECGWLVTMDDAIGDHRRARVLVEGNRIVAAGQGITADADEVIDASDMIVMPGLINAHLHTWQTGLRAIGSEWLGPDYHKNIHANLATHYGPEDNYLGNLVGALAQIDGGVTTVLDWCHNLTSLEHAERSVDGLEASGIRAVFAHGTAKPPTRPGEVPYTHVPHPRDRIEALRKSRFASDDRLVTLAMAILGPHWGTYEVAEQDLRLARELGLLSTSHATRKIADQVAPGGYKRLVEAGLIGPDHNLVHGNYIEDEELKPLVEAGASVTATVLVELHGHAADPVTLRVRAFGGLPSIGIDVEPIVTGEMFREMQAALLHARWAALRENAAAGRPPLQVMPVRSREALLWATIGNARAIGLEDQIGSITPGKKADLVMLRASDLNLFPVHDPLLSITDQAHAGNVDTVMIDGVVRKQGGRRVFPDDVLARRRAELVTSVERVMRAGGFVLKAA
ncbi:amidohydrolase family protein [Bradyrhizobium sp. U87765 SZCCT0131]|uniref:amidohydrolase family protein n=1 Tax=unclassified Bradyrhizobium TaxID=2631580 RepID=UPI001BA88212|nr:MULTISPECIES: amidohydrolase family protein [unclassified Bradyrhizobium]MBR1222494.1 amidohydrolase family protein [Bradyrhizobium sp. U87765 SZCCT0131]MBR1265425.1 amidohydrolase family protein [Bradyrhizobium sp. U87765 SZCCT0134]MBR1302796.1 amidohydrolase family protein [Bradyrhizobium sp. U87765 SZCCT0110]MBR1323494.1 amidohydrolase family protein [Bradyrhizobium sp. U87765 SZCCT0109]MBR1346725.1 amidohydrolase family protein [Bradyrhizobium sp. U87765 SZCCT0048]